MVQCVYYVLPVLWMTLYLPVIGEAKTTHANMECSQSDSPGGRKGAKYKIALFVVLY